MFNGNVYVLSYFTPANPSNFSAFAKGQWKTHAIVTDIELAKKWVKLDERNRKYELVDTDECEELVTEEVTPIKEEL